MRSKLVLSGFLIVSVAIANAQRPGPDKFKERMESLPPILQSALRAGVNLSFSGTRLVTVRRAGVVESHLEVITKAGPRMRIEFESDSKMVGQVIVENGGQRQHFMPDKNEIRVSRSRMDDSLGRLRKALKDRKDRNHDFKVSPGGVIAGFETERVSMVDPSGNPVFDFYVDPKSGLMLKRVMYDKVGSVVGSFEFKSVKLNPKIAPDAFAIKRRGATIVTVQDELNRSFTKLGWSRIGLAAGTRFELDGVRVLTPEGTQVMAQLYASPEGRVTLFVTKQPLSDAALKRLSRGQSRSYVWKDGEYSLALLGEVSESRLRDLSKSVTR